MDQLSADLEHKARKAVTKLELRKVTLLDRENGAAGDCSVCLEPMMVRTNHTLQSNIARDVYYGNDSQ